jgi:hypothetical protein
MAERFWCRMIYATLYQLQRSEPNNSCAGQQCWLCNDLGETVRHFPYINWIKPRQVSARTASATSRSEPVPWVCSPGIRQLCRALLCLTCSEGQAASVMMQQYGHDLSSTIWYQEDCLWIGRWKEWCHQNNTLYYGSLASTDSHRPVLQFLDQGWPNNCGFPCHRSVCWSLNHMRPRHICCDLILSTVTGLNLYGARFHICPTKLNFLWSFL